MPAERAQLLDLAERVEKASRPDRELDAEIEAVVRTGVTASYLLAYRFTKSFDRMVRCWTASMDAALTLVPEDCSWGGGDLDEDGNPWACVTSNAEPCSDYAGKAVNVAMSVVAASLRALAAQPQEEGSSDGR